MALGAATSSFPFPEDLGDLMWGSVGQAQVLATPLADGYGRGDDRERRQADGAAHRPVGRLRQGSAPVSRKTAATMKTLMRSVVPAAPGPAPTSSGVSVAGKTGTAEVDVGGERKNHAWFVCFAPVENPKVAVAVVSEYGGVGGQVAAPLARQILLNVLPIVAVRAVVQRVSDGKRDGRRARDRLDRAGALRPAGDLYRGRSGRGREWVADKIVNLQDLHPTTRAR